jgi:hypothetical protein
LETPFIDVASQLVALMPNLDERGLLGLGFDAGFTSPENPELRRISSINTPRF